jgi:hypothetical protein
MRHDRNVRKMIRNLTPTSVDDLSESVQLHFTKEHFSEQLLVVLRADCKEVCGRLGVIETFQAYRMASRQEWFFAHASCAIVTPIRARGVARFRRGAACCARHKTLARAKTKTSRVHG